VNTFVVTTTNSCGTDAETITINYQPCVAPVISILAPASNGTTVATAAFTFTATILNSNNGQGIGFTQNGRAINSVNFNTTTNTLSGTVKLVPGVNTFIVTATNACGTDTETITINYVPQMENKKPSPGKQEPTAPGTGRGGK
jgi:PKD repeat protein